MTLLPPVDLAMESLLWIDGVPDVDQCWALDVHSRRGQRTPAGDLVYEGKHYGDRPGDAEAAHRLAETLGWWYSRVNELPRFHVEVEVIAPVPSLRQRRPHNLPAVLARGVGRALPAPVDDSLLYVDRKVPEMKGIDPEDRPGLLRGAFGIDGVLSGGVVLVDDLLQSGSTLAECARVLRAAGATQVVALCATRATKGMGTWGSRERVALGR